MLLTLTLETVDVKILVLHPQHLPRALFLTILAECLAWNTQKNNANCIVITYPRFSFTHQPRDTKIMKQVLNISNNWNNLQQGKAPYQMQTITKNEKGWPYNCSKFFYLKN